MPTNKDKIIITEEPVQQPSLPERTLARTATRLAEQFGSTGSLAQHIPEGIRNIPGLGFLPERGQVPLSLLGGPGIEAARRAYNFVTGQNITDPMIPLPTKAGITQKAEELAQERYGTADVLKPQNVVENIADRFVSYIPHSLAWGMTDPTNLLNSVTSAVAGGTLEKYGFGPEAQALGELAGGLGTSMIRSKILSGTEKAAKELQEKSFNLGKDIGKTIPVLDPEAFQYISNLNLKAQQFPELYKKQTRGIIRRLNNFMESGNLSAEGAWDIKQRIDKLYKHGGSESPIYQELRTMLDKSLKKIGIENPEFGKHYYLANDVTQGLINAKKSAKIIKQSPSILSKLSNPVALMYAVKSFLKGDIMEGLKTIGGAAVAEYVQGKYSQIKGVYQSSPTIRNILVDMTKEAALKDKAVMSRLATQLNNEVEKYFPVTQNDKIIIEG